MVINTAKWIWYFHSKFIRDTPSMVGGIFPWLNAAYPNFYIVWVGHARWRKHTFLQGLRPSFEYLEDYRRQIFNVITKFTSRVVIMTIRDHLWLLAKFTFFYHYYTTRYTNEFDQIFFYLLNRCIAWVGPSMNYALHAKLARAYYTFGSTNFSENDCTEHSFTITP